MSVVPNTLEEVQYQVLQGDLTLNPKLQPSSIPAKDKELKTVAKKVVPAINELVKLVAVCKQSVDSYSSKIEEKVNAFGSALGETLKQEQLDHLNTQIEVIEKDTKQALEAISQSLSTEYGEEMEKRVNELEAQMNEIIASKVLEVIKNLPQGGTGAGGGTSMKRVFHSKAEIGGRDTTGVKAPFKMTEVQDLAKQIEVVSATTYNAVKGSYVDQYHRGEYKSTSSSAYEVYGYPVDIAVDSATDEIYVRTTATNKLTVYFYTME